MPFSCPVCGNEDYDEEDGGFFCTECGTQSQEYIVQEVTDTVYDPGRERHRVAEARADTSVNNPKASLGRPWTIYEAYQTIILAQVDCLISLGASEDLKDVVYTIWANYLSKLGVAFCSTEKVVPEVVDKYKIGRPREIFRGTLQNPSNWKAQPMKSKSKRKVAAKRKRTHSRSSTEGVTDVDEGTEESIDPSKIIFLDTIKTSNTNAYMAARRSATNSPEWMDIHKTIAFCYIGLLFTSPDILTIDVMRWLYTGKVPLLSTSHLLPQDMMLSCYDSLLFKIECFTTDNLIQEVNKLCNYLNLTDLPGPDLPVVASRFIRDLCLPQEFDLFVWRLIKKIPYIPNFQRNSLYKPREVVALGYIILAFKIVFGLDDISERKLSYYTQKLQNLCQLELSLFNWTDWRKFWVYKQCHQFDAYQQLNSELSSSKLEHLDQFLQCYESSNQSKRRLSVRYTLSTKGRQVRAFEPEFRDALTKPLAAAIAETNVSAKGSNLSEEPEEDMEGKKFENMTVCHLVDAIALRRRLEPLDADTRLMCEDLLAQGSTLQPKFVHYQFPTRDTELHSQRHESYLWLLDLASKRTGFRVAALDKMVLRLAEFFMLLLEGKSTKGLSASQYGVVRLKRGRHVVFPAMDC